MGFLAQNWMKTKEIMWAIIGTCGLYTGTWLYRRDAIEEHCEALGKNWKYCRRKGDKAVKVSLSILE